MRTKYRAQVMINKTNQKNQRNVKKILKQGVEIEYQTTLIRAKK
jgi:hypothetical protein